MTGEPSASVPRLIPVVRRSLSTSLLAASVLLSLSGIGSGAPAFARQEAPAGKASPSVLHADSVVSSGVEAELKQAIRRSLPGLVQVRCVVWHDGKHEATGCCASSGETVRSGVLLDRSGRLVTIADTLHGVRAARVRLWDGEDRLARFVGLDEITDLALFDAGPIGFALPPLAERATLVPGSLVLAIGNPYGAYGSVSIGYVSGVSRVLAKTSGRWAYEGLVQITTPVLPGDAGGILANRKGEIVGMLLTSLSPIEEEMTLLRAKVASLEKTLRAFEGSAAAAPMSPAPVLPREGIHSPAPGREKVQESPREPVASFAPAHEVSFAWPASRVGDALRRIQEGKTSRKARPLRLGVVLDRPAASAVQTTDGGPRGLVVLHVLPGLPADRAGIRVRDVLLRADEIDLNGFDGLRQALENAAATHLMRLRVLRERAGRDIVVRWEAGCGESQQEHVGKDGGPPEDSR